MYTRLHATLWCCMSSSDRSNSRSGRDASTQRPERMLVGGSSAVSFTSPSSDAADDRPRLASSCGACTGHMISHKPERCGSLDLDFAGGTGHAGGRVVSGGRTHGSARDGADAMSWVLGVLQHLG